MYLTCLDLEGVLTPEMWILTAEQAGIPELRVTTREEPDYDKLMQYRIRIMKEHGLKIQDMQQAIAKADPLPGARKFLDELRTFSQVIIVSDCFEQLARPLIAKLGYPTIFCHELVADGEGTITDYRMRIRKDTKLTTVKAFQQLGFDTVASGDSYNDLDMIRASKAGFLFRTTDQIKKDNPDIPALETYDELLSAIRSAEKQ